MTDRENVLKGLECCSKGDCSDCYQGGPGFGYECKKSLMRDALVLLKKQEPHLLMLDEACGGGECWIEGRSGACGYADCVYVGYGDSFPDIEINRTHDISFVNSKDYMRIWRCWDRRPTDEQRKGVKWDA